MEKKHLYIILGIVSVLIIGSLIGLFFGLKSSGEKFTKSTSTVLTTEGSTIFHFDTSTTIFEINLTTSDELKNSDKTNLASGEDTRSSKKATKSTSNHDKRTTETVKPIDQKTYKFFSKMPKELTAQINHSNLKHQTSFYFFNVTNPEKVEKGEKPILVEMGPYKFDEKRIYDLQSLDNEHLNLKFKKNYIFTGIGNLDDNVTVLNVPLVSVYNIINQFPISFLGRGLINRLILNKHPLFISRRVGDLLFDGYEDSIVDNIKNAIKLLNLLVNFKIPTSIDTNGRFSFMASRNNSDYGLWTINTGLEDKHDLGQLFKINGKSDVTCWKDKCSAMKGSDGIIFSPFSGLKNQLDIFVPELNRSIALDYDKDKAYKKIPTRRFIWSPNTFKSSSSYPPNKCFYTDSKDELNKYSGVLFNSHCNFNIPIAFSNPHFYQADDYYRDTVLGMNPVQNKHESSIELRKNNGELILANKNLQINIDTKTISSKRSIERFIFPLFYLAEVTRNVV